MKHYFDKWMFHGMLREMKKTNFILNKTCENFAMKCDELQSYCHSCTNECNTLREKYESLREESKEVLINLIDIKVSTAEEALQRIRKARV